MICIGNDIVDLTHRENRRKSRDRRFVSRVFTAEEQGWIEGSERPDVTLWMLWAAKEAAFKVAGKLKPETAFVPKAYAVTLAHYTPSEGFGEGVPSGIPEKSSGAMHGVVVTPAGPVNMSCFFSTDHVHCVAAGKNSCPVVPVLSHVRTVERKIDSPAEPSAAVRWEAIHYLASALKVSPYFIRIHRERMLHGYGPPRVFMEGRRTDIDISLSHDGRYIAFALHFPDTGEAPDGLDKPVRLHG